MYCAVRLSLIFQQGSANIHDVSRRKEHPSECTLFSPDAVAEAQRFWKSIESRRRAFSPDSAELSPLKRRLIDRIKTAFSGVSCYRELRVLLGGEAEDDYLSPEAQALLVPLEERSDWQNIPDDLLFACSCALSYVGPHAYRFLIPRFLVGALQGVVEIYPGSGPSADPEISTRNQMLYLDEAQRNCLSDYLNLVSVEEEESECRRGGYLPWEHDEYRELYATEMDYRDYGRMLIRRYREREGI